MTKFTASGDALIMLRLPPHPPGFAPISEYIQRGDARITNLETVLATYDCFASAYCGGTWLTTTPDVLDDLIAYGFNLYAWANNHTMDYAYDGLVATKRALEDRGLAHAGAGLSLYEASRPASLNTDGGRVAMISLCSTFVDAARAGNPHCDIPARPGLNPLRFSVQHIVTREQLEGLKAIADATALNARTDLSRAQGFTPPPPEGCFDFGGVLLREGDVPGRTSAPNETDMGRTEATIRTALMVHDYVVVCAHCHEFKGRRDTEPDYFIEEFSRRCIDAGACAVVGTGSHQLRGIEIYRGRPIFYGLGNFIFQNNSPERQPADFNEKYSLPAEYGAEQGLHARSAGNTRGLHADPVYFRSVLPYWEMEGNRLTRLELLPIDLGFHLPVGTHGLPTPAEPETVIADLRQLSKPYGTQFRVQQDVVEVILPEVP